MLTDLKQNIAIQIETILSTYNPYKDQLDESEKKELEQLNNCLSAIKD